MRPYSMDLRRKVLAAYDRGEGSQRQLAKRFDLAPSTVQSWLRRRRQTGAALPKKPGAPSPKLDADGRERLREIIIAAPDATLGEWADRLEDETGLGLHPSTIWHHARRLGFTRKKRRPGPANSNATTSGSNAGSSNA